MATSFDRDKALDVALAQIEKQHGKGSVMRLGERAATPIEVIPTGSIALDVALGIGGLPRGRVIEIYGPESSGKTTVALHAVANAQALGGVAAFIDAERSRVLGVKGVLRIDERGDAAGGLRIRDRVQRDRGLSRAFRPVDLDDPPAWQTTDAERDIQGDRSAGDHLDRRGGALAEAHDRTLAVLLLDLCQGDVERLVPVETGCHQGDPLRVLSCRCRRR